MRSLLLFCLLLVQLPFAWAWQGIVDQVMDGDTLKVRHDSGRYYNVRLYGVDSPEMGQRHGPEARDAARKLVQDKSVNVQVINVDSNGTTTAVVYVNDQYSLQAFLVGSGLAWVYDGHCDLKICNQWQSMQTQAREANRGLWNEAHPVAPWRWRQQKATPARATSSGKATRQRKTTRRTRKTVKKAPADISAQLQN